MTSSQAKYDRHRDRILVMNPLDFAKKSEQFATERRPAGLMSQPQFLYWYHGCEVISSYDCTPGLVEIRPKNRKASDI